MAGRLEQPRDRVAEHRVAPVPDGQRSGGIGREKFDLHLAAVADLRTKRRRAERRGPAQLAMPIAGRHAKVDKAGTGDGHFLNFRAASRNALG